MNEKLQQIGAQIPYLQMGSNFLIGLSVGYFIKKSFKLVLILTGLTIVVMFVLESKGIISINESSLDQTVSLGAHGFSTFISFLRERLSKLTIAGGGSAIAGFVLGLKWG